MKETKKCPFCGEEILAEAKKCKYCGEWLDKESTLSKTEKVKTEIPTKKVFQKLGIYIAYIFSGFFFLISLIECKIFDFPLAIIFFICSILILPNFSNLLQEKFQSNLKAPVKSILVIIILLIYAICTTDLDRTNNLATKQNKKTIYNIGEEVNVGYMTYQVNKINWTKRIGNKYTGTNANSTFLLVNISARNNDREERTVPPFLLKDQNEYEYEESDSNWQIGEEAFLIENLNPNVTKSGILVFDVPQENSYKLIVHGGYFSSETAIINLN